MKKIIMILGDQLSLDISAFDGVDKKNDQVLMIEAEEEFRYVRHHKQKIVLILSAMRHFADLLHEKGFKVEYIYLDDHSNSGSLSEELYKSLKRHQAGKLVITEPGDFRMWKYTHSWKSELGISVEIREDNRFICTKEQFADWAAGRKTLRMEHFYREMRRRTGFLMDGNKPEGDRWNYDDQNRKIVPKGVVFPEQLRFTPDKITSTVIDLVENNFADHFGTTANFNWAVSRDGALKVLKDFIENSLPLFGDYQDVMRDGESRLYHSAISPYINLGLLQPLEVCQAVLQAHKKGLTPINCAEGFLRQILGWREYIRGIYWLKMPGYKDSNYFDAQRPLPDFYWTGKTKLRCMAETINDTYYNAYAHHIQRLMITGNFALLAGIKPEEVEEWYLIVYADAFEWVELPNTYGMALYAGGGLLASKPYAASAAYINRMSDYCRHCAYKHGEKIGSQACPFNYLYWNFLLSNKHKLKSNPRMGLAYKMLSRMTEEEHSRIQQEAAIFLESFSASTNY